MSDMPTLVLHNDPDQLYVIQTPGVGVPGTSGVWYLSVEDIGPNGNAPAA